MNVCGAVVPSFPGHVGETVKTHVHFRGLIRLDCGFHGGGLVFESFDHIQTYSSWWHLQREFTLSMKSMPGRRAADPGIRIGRRIKLTIRGEVLNPRCR